MAHALGSYTARNPDSSEYRHSWFFLIFGFSTYLTRMCCTGPDQVKCRSQRATGWLVRKDASGFHLLPAGVPDREHVHSACAAAAEPGGGGPSGGHVGHAVVVRSGVRVSIDVGVCSGRSFGACG